MTRVQVILGDPATEPVTGEDFTAGAMVATLGPARPEDGVMPDARNLLLLLADNAI